MEKNPRELLDRGFSLEKPTKYLFFLSYHSYIYVSDTTLSSGRLSTCTFKDLLGSGGEVGVGHSTQIHGT